MSTETATRQYEDALRFVLNRVNYERTLSVPYCSREYKLDLEGLLQYGASPRATLESRRASAFQTT